MISGLSSLLVAATAALLLPVNPVSEDPPDLMVLLDDAKMTIADGKLEHALELLSELEPDGVEPLVDQEILFQRMMLNSAFLAATHYLLDELDAGGLVSSPYGSWLARERTVYEERFAADASAFLAATAEGPALDFVRFRLPEVTDEYLEDAGLYADAQVLSAAVTNFDDGRDGLGRGVVVAQARVALVLFTAVYYDLPDAAGSLELAADRLRAGVPLDEAILLNWLAGFAGEIGGNDELLRQLAEDTRLRIRQRGYLKSFDENTFSAGPTDDPDVTEELNSTQPEPSG